MSFSLVFRFLLPYNLLWYSSIFPLNVVIAASTNSSHHRICGSSHKTNPLTANVKTNKNRNEQILRNAEDTVRIEETDDTHKCQRRERLTKIKIAYETGTLTIAEAENYYPTCQGRNLICRLTIENKVTGHAEVYISPFACNFQKNEPTFTRGKYTCI